MKYYFAPLEGLTGYIFRNAHYTYFKNIDKYFSPFISTFQNGNTKARDLNDILPENNRGFVLVPQLLSNNAKDFINTSKIIKELGYKEINLNLGCPSGTVVSKNKGSGFLAKREELDAFLEEIYAAAVTEISIKTRIGKDSPEEFYQLIEIFNRYPVKELIIHPRIQKDFYKNKPNRKIFEDALSLSQSPVCYNGDIFTAHDYQDFIKTFPNVDTLMLGRGLLANPGLINEITLNTSPDKNIMKDFHDRIYEDYRNVLYGERNVLFKMKELWFYMITIFAENDKYAKKIKKAQRLSDYEEAVARLFEEQEITQNLDYSF